MDLTTGFDRVDCNHDCNKLREVAGELDRAARAREVASCSAAVTRAAMWPRASAPWCARLLSGESSEPSAPVPRRRRAMCQTIEGHSKPVLRHMPRMRGDPGHHS